MKNLNLSWTSDIKCLAWDLDGTLYPPDSRLDHAIESRITAAVARTQQVSSSRAEELFSNTYNKLRSKTKSLSKLGIPGQEFFLNVWNEVDLSQFIQPNPQLAVALIALSESGKFDLAILTNSNTSSTVASKLAMIGIDPHCFKHILTSVDIGFQKPDPEAFTALLQATNHRPDRVLYVGDRENTDIIPAQLMGLRTALIRNNSADSSSQADLIMPSALDLAEFFLKNTING